MANIRPNALPDEANPNSSDVVIIDGLTTRKTTLEKAVNAGRPNASQAEAEAGVNSVKGMTPLTTRQAIVAYGSNFAPAAKGVPIGGTTAQVLAKNSNTDNDLKWTNVGAGDVISVNNGSDFLDKNSVLTNIGAGPTFGTASLAAAYAPVTAPDYIRTSGYAAAGDSGGALYKRVGSMPSHAGRFSITLFGGGTIWYEIAETVLSPAMLGAALNGTTNDATAFANTLAVVAAKGTGIIDLGGKTLRSDSAQTIPAKMLLQNGIIDFSNAPTSVVAFDTGGSDGTAINIVGTLTEGASSITVPDGTQFSAMQYIWITSSDLYDFAASIKGEWQQVRSVSGNTVSFYGRLRDTYTTSVKVYRPTMKNGIRLRNVTFLGGGDAQAGVTLRLQYCTDLAVTNCIFKNFGDRFIEVRRSLDIVISGNTMQHANEDTGTAYGVCMVNGCERFTVSGNTASDVRHGVTVGGEDGVDRFGTVYGNALSNMADSGVDCHPNSEHIVMHSNVIDVGHYTADPDANRHGITAQGAHMSVIGNTIKRCQSVGIHLQPLTRVTNDTLICADNIIETDVANTTGIFLDGQKPAGSMRGIIISDNMIRAETSTSTGIEVSATTNGGTIDGVTIAGNRVYCAGTALRLRTAANRILEDVAVSGNSFRNTGTGSVIELYNGTSGAFLTAVTITGNALRGGTYGINVNLGAANADRVLATSNIMQGFATAATNGTLTAANNITT